MWFKAPYILTSVVLSLVYIFAMRQERVIGHEIPDAYPEPAKREKLFLVIGEVHNPKKDQAGGDSILLTIPEPKRRVNIHGVRIRLANGWSQPILPKKRCRRSVLPQYQPTPHRSSGF